MSGIGRILSDQDIPNLVKLDDFLHSECLQNISRAVLLLDYWGFKINVSKSILLPTQKV